MWTRRRLVFGTRLGHSGAVKTSITLDPELKQELRDTQSITGESQGAVMRMALRVGLPTIRNRFQAPRPEGYFASDYGRRNPEREHLEAAMAKAKQRPER